MSSILDIDLDYFNLLEDPLGRFEELLAWANRPVALIVKKHDEAFARWKGRMRRGSLGAPQWILHVDEHHDMMDERENANIAHRSAPRRRTARLLRLSPGPRGRCPARGA
jgi:hypothetical protein